MEPEPNSQTQSVAESGRTDGEIEATHICSVCRQSIVRTADRRCRDELVHQECLAELRCGVSIGAQSHRRRTRERDSQ